jgi:hypothetical protein
MVAVGLVGPSCDSDDPQACQKISDACHELDKGPGSGKPHECHRISHTDDVERCNQSLDDCVGFCSAEAAKPDAAGSAGGGGGSGGSSGSGGGGAGGQSGTGGSASLDARASSPDGPAPDRPPAPSRDAIARDTGAAVSDACMKYCACMTKQCASKPGAPAWLKTADLCPAQCATFSAQQLTCWSGFCNPNAAMVSAHNCEHGWGSQGLSECAP